MPFVTVKNFYDSTRKHWNDAQYVEARFTPTDKPSNKPPIDGEPPVSVDFATVSAKWFEPRQIDFVIEPMKHGRKISRYFFDHNFTLWPRGYDFS